MKVKTEVEIILTVSADREVSSQNTLSRISMDAINEAKTLAKTLIDGKPGVLSYKISPVSVTLEGDPLQG